jgi:hypothetical protein
MPPKPLNLGGGSKPPEPQSGGRVPKPLSVPEPSAPAAPPRLPPGRPSALTLGNAAAPAASGQVEQLVQQIVGADPALQPLAHRLRPRLQTLLNASDTELMAWGEQNLQAMQDNSKVQAKVSQRLSQLNVTEWAHKCKEASTRVPSWKDRFIQPEGPEFYERKLRQIQQELVQLMPEMERAREELTPEVEDLRLDAAALGAIAPLKQDATTTMIVSNRLRTLITGQQATAQLLQQAETTRMTLAQCAQSIDQLLTVTLPAWRTANGS